MLSSVRLQPDDHILPQDVLMEFLKQYNPELVVELVVTPISWQVSTGSGALFYATHDNMTIEAYTITRSPSLVVNDESSPMFFTLSDPDWPQKVLTFLQMSDDRLRILEFPFQE